jgi:hypothetical protein
VTPVVVDTNVAVVANDGDSEFPKCVRACVARLTGVTRDGCVVLDESWRILSEYTSNLRSLGQPGVGDAFLKWVLTNLANPGRCAQVSITPSDTRVFEEFPDDPDLAGFDADDRKFVAVARAHPAQPPVLQALDSGWWGHRDALARNGVAVDFLCAGEIESLHERKARR